MNRGPTEERIRLAREAANLRAQGLTWREVGEWLGTSRSYAAELVHDPDGSKGRARKDSYAGTCRHCGKPTTGANGRAKAPEVCHECAERAGPRKWTREAVLEKLAEWRDTHPGVLPNANLWLRHEQDANVHVTTIQERFGSWRAAWALVGVDIPEVGRYHRTDEWRRNTSERLSKNETDYKLLLELAEQHPDWTYGDIGAAVGLGKTRVGQVVAKYRPDLRRTGGRRKKQTTSGDQIRAGGSERTAP